MGNQCDFKFLWLENRVVAWTFFRRHLSSVQLKTNILYYKDAIFHEIMLNMFLNPPSIFFFKWME